MDEYAKENMTAPFFLEIKEKLQNPIYYNILNITEDKLKNWTEKKLTEKITTSVVNKYVDDTLITELTSKVIAEYEKITE